MRKSTRPKNMRSATAPMRSRSWWRAFFKAVMAYFRILLRGIWSPPPGDYAGFFATRTVKSARIEDAKAAGLSALAHEWAETPFFEQGGAAALGQHLEAVLQALGQSLDAEQIGRASCRERVCQYV